jgi:thymidine kinase
MQKPGELDLILGPMFSGKTTELVRRISRLNMPCITQGEVLVISHVNDLNRTKGKKVIQTHTGGNYPCEALAELGDLPPSKLNKAKYIFIEEGQFFPDLLNVIEWVETLGKHVTVAGLNGDIHRRPFGKILELIPFVRNIEMKSALCCRCARNGGRLEEAHFSHCLPSSTLNSSLHLVPITPEKEEKGANYVKIGGADKYEALCRACFIVDE